MHITELASKTDLLADEFKRLIDLDDWEVAELIQNEWARLSFDERLEINGLLNETATGSRKKYRNILSELMEVGGGELQPFYGLLKSYDLYVSFHTDFTQLFSETLVLWAGVRAVPNSAATTSCFTQMSV